MATTRIAGFDFPASAIARPVNPARAEPRRRVDPRAARAMRTLRHAIEYLAGEFVKEEATLSGNSPRLAAVRLLMDLNSRVYLECPAVAPLRQRIFGHARHTTL